MAFALNPGTAIRCLALLAAALLAAMPVRAQDAHAPQAAGKFNQLADNARAAWKVRRVVIDPGHGGKDPGCHGAHAREKDIALGISKILAELLRQQYPEVEVLLTREEDVFVPLNERAALANKARADLFISIHCNYIRGSAATRGTETYVMGLHTAEENLEVAKRENAVILLEDNYREVYGFDPDSPEGHILLTMVQHAFLDQSIRFAQLVEDHMAAARRRSRGVKQAGFVVLRQTTMPSVLVETGFLSNEAEEDFLLSREGQYTIARALAAAFGRYKAEVEGVGGVFAAVPSPSSPSEKEAASPAEAQVLQVAGHVARTEGTGAVAKQASSHGATAPKAEMPEGEREENALIVPVEDLSARAPRPALPPQLHYRVQLAASREPLSEAQWQQTGFTIEVVEEDGLYKYQAGRFRSFREAFAARRQLQSRGFVDAFVVAYEGTRRISLKEARARLGD